MAARLTEKSSSERISIYSAIYTSRYYIFSAFSYNAFSQYRPTNIKKITRYVKLLEVFLFFFFC